jgi:hypothetical protein
MATKAKSPGKTRKQDAAKRGVVTAQAAQAESEEQVKERRLEEAISRLHREHDQDFDAGYKQGGEDGEEWACSASLRDLRRVCGAGTTMYEDELLDLLSDYWNAQDLDDLGADCDRTSFLRGYPEGFREGAHKVWNRLEHVQ